VRPHQHQHPRAPGFVRVCCRHTWTLVIREGQKIECRIVQMRVIPVVQTVEPSLRITPAMPPQTKSVPVKDLSLDLSNFRTVKQPNERSAIDAMISTSPDRFWALTGSLLDTGYLPTDNIIVIRGGGNTLTVKEGNRRIAALKLIHKVHPLSAFEVPQDIADRIKGVKAAWRKDNADVPCAIYDAGDAAIVDRIVTLAHGKGEKAGRDQWNAVARARHNRDINKVAESALDLLEKYLQSGKNVTPVQKARWSGAFPLSVLEEAMKRIAPRLGLASATALASAYPTVKFRDEIETIIHDIGQARLDFDRIREKVTDFAEEYGLPAAKATGGAKGKGTTKGAATKPTKSAAAAATRRKQKAAQKAIATGDPRAVKRLFQDFTPLGRKREKLVALRNEIILLDFQKTPLAFCFVLRSMFELSAKAYCADHSASGGPTMTKAGGEERHLVDVLREITTHLMKGPTGKADREKQKQLHGAMTELGKSEGILSVTSMNQLIHNPRFSVTTSDLAVVAANIFPLLEAMSS
jgi:hypothetical protein